MWVSIVPGTLKPAAFRRTIRLGGLSLWLALSPSAASAEPESADSDADLFEALDAAEGVSAYPDPLEPANRATLEFNEALDRFVISPISRGYAAVMPDPAERAVRRIFRNAAEPISFLNHVLQLHPRRAGETLVRFCMNTTAGVVGIVDVATPGGLPEQHTDFGGTLHRYGTPSGPYLIVPVLGPSTARDATGDVVDFFIGPQSYLLSGAGQFVIGTGNGISFRTEHGQALEALREQSVDFYAALRTAYFFSRESELSGVMAEPSATLSSSAVTSASKPSRSSTDVYSARFIASSETVPPR
jgi:phospholipid-binding lipoprotein MlaA